MERLEREKRRETHAEAVGNTVEKRDTAADDEAEDTAGDAGSDGEAGESEIDAESTEDDSGESTPAADDDDAPTEADLEEERAYEARRAARAERLRRRKRKQRRRRAAIAGFATAAVVVLGTGYYFGDEVMDKLQSMEKMIAENRKNREAEKAAKEASAKAEAEKQKAPAITATPTPSAADELRTAENRVIRKARKYAYQYDYDKAINVLQTSDIYSKSDRLKKYEASYAKKKAQCVPWNIEEITHVFFHSLVVDPAKAFDGDVKSDGFNQMMTTVDEFNKIIQSMYDKGYVMVSLKDIATADENGNMTQGEILLPPGKVPFVLSQDDVCYYHFMDNNGFASKLVLDENGVVKNEYIEEDGSVSIGDYDMVPLIDSFLKKHPDFSYRGAKGVLALTGYNGILGYRTDISYQEVPKDIDDDKREWLEAHPDFSLEAERAEAKKVADALKKTGWEFASHTWGHLNVADVSLERLQRDTEKFKENVDPLIGGTDMIIFAFGADFIQGGEYYGDKFDFYKSSGYNYFCNVDSQKYFVQLRDNYLRMGRRNLDGYRMYYNPELVDDLFDAASVFDPGRPVPVAPMS